MRGNDLKNEPKIGVLGSGNWGTVVALLAAQKQKKVLLFDRDPARAQQIQNQRINTKYLPGITLPANIEITSDLKKVFDQCSLIFPIIPSSQFRRFTQSFAPWVRGDHFLVHGTKGLEAHSCKRMSEIITEETGILRIGALSGPNLAQELAEQKPGATVVASRFHEVIKAAQDALSSHQLQVYGNSDLVGVEWIGSLKNILAIAAGTIHGLKLGNNALAMILTRGIAEMKHLLHIVGAQPSTIIGLAGIGDIMATCSSPLSRNFQAGALLAQGYSINEIEKKLAMTIEGLNTLLVAKELAQKHRAATPISNAVYSIAYQKKDARRTIEELVAEPASFE